MAHPPSWLRPTPSLTPQQRERSLFLLRWQGALSGAMFSLGSGSFLAAYALALGANNFQIGVLAALPFIGQVMQMPGVVLVEHVRSRKLISFSLFSLAQLMWVPIGLVPLLIGTPGGAAITTIIVVLGLRSVFNPLALISSTSWMRDLVPQAILGTYYSRRQGLQTALSAVVGVGGGYFIDFWQRHASAASATHGFAFLLLGGALTMGLSGPVLFALSSEPQMPPRPAEGPSTLGSLLKPWRDPDFKHLVRFLFLWSFFSNLAIPFFAVYMLTRLHLSLTSVMLLTTLSQVSNLWFLRVWGPLADRLGSKTVLSMSASLYLLVIIGWTFTTFPDRYFLSIPLLIVLHVFAGVAAGGVTLTVGTLNLKMAPENGATPYLAVAGVGAAVGQGLGPLAGGLLADYFAVHTFQIGAQWIGPGGTTNFPNLTLTGFDFLFAIAFVGGLFSLNLLVALKEEGEVPRDVALRELMQDASSLVARASSVPGVSLLMGPAYGYLRRIPGLDVAMGVTAHQLAASTRSAAQTASRGRNLVQVITRNIAETVAEAAERLEDVAQMGVDIGRLPVKAAVNSAGGATHFIQDTVVAMVRAVSRTPASTSDALEGAGYGAVEGAIEAGVDPGGAAVAAVEGAREAAEQTELSAEEAAVQTAAGALAAAEAAGEETLASVEQALPEDIAGQARRVIEEGPSAQQGQAQ